MQVTKTELPGVLLIEPKVFGDSRGFFMELYSAERYAQHGVPASFVQDNLSKSVRGVLRGLHLQNPFAQGKLVFAAAGEIFDVVVDVRRGSPTFGRWYGAVLSDTNKRQLWVPPGCAHGFCVTSEEATFMYKCTDLYHPEAEVTVLYNDPALGIRWPVSEPTVSAKDAAGKPLAAIEPERLPVYQG
jgi:dTDP-4-dehydrorhamnose 3,5-epimerase